LLFIPFAALIHSDRKPGSGGSMDFPHLNPNRPRDIPGREFP
jgi:hypothetical protein